MPRQIREPIQVYLTEQEREELDRLASEFGVSRSELLRRGVAALGSGDTTGPLRNLVTEGLVTPAVMLDTDPPLGKPVAPLKDILSELDADRSDR